MLRRTVFALSVVVAVVGAGFAQETSKALPRPDGKPADHSEQTARLQVIRGAVYLHDRSEQPPAVVERLA